MNKAEDKSWKTEKFRQGIKWKLEEALQESGRMPFVTSTYVENLIFEDSSNRDDYLNYVAKWILRLRAPPGEAAPILPGLPDLLSQALPQRNISTLTTSSDSSVTTAVQESLAHPSTYPIETNNSALKSKRRPKKHKWKSIQFRQSMTSRLNDAMIRSGEERNITASDLEKHIFKKSSTKDEYLDGVAKWILRLEAR